jgi:hypothetical protein
MIYKKNCCITGKTDLTILINFSEKIIAHALANSTWKRVQQVVISYHIVGVIDLPDTNDINNKPA